jgi:hypothetical protein
MTQSKALSLRVRITTQYNKEGPMNIFLQKSIEGHLPLFNADIQSRRQRQRINRGLSLLCIVDEGSCLREKY